MKQYRNAIVHGFSHDAFSEEVVRDAIRSVRRMMADAGQLAAGWLRSWGNPAEGETPGR